jgi:hypothetical protein
MLFTRNTYTFTSICMLLRPVTLDRSLKHEDSSACLMYVCLESAQLDVVLEHEVKPSEVFIQQFEQIVSSHTAPLRNWFLQHRGQTTLIYVRFQVLTAASMMFRIVFWDVLSWALIPVDGGSTHLWNVGRQLFYTAVHPRRQFWIPLFMSHFGHSCYNAQWVHCVMQ